MSKKPLEEKVKPLSAKELVILEVLLEAKFALYGLEIVAQSKGRLKRGSAYVTLSRMQVKGYLTSNVGACKNLSGTPRRWYEPTGYGYLVFGAWKRYQQTLSRARYAKDIKVFSDPELSKPL